MDVSRSQIQDVNVVGCELRESSSSVVISFLRGDQLLLSAASERGPVVALKTREGWESLWGEGD